MNDKVSQAIVDAAEKLGFAVDRVWPQIVMHTWVTSLFWTVMDPVLIVVAIYVARRAIDWLALNEEASQADYEKEQAADRSPSSFDYDTTEVKIVTVVIVACCAFLGFAALLSFPGNLAGVFFPEAQAVLKLAGK